MATIGNPYYNAQWAEAGQNIAKILGGDPEMAAKLKYTEATTALSDAKAKRQQMQNDELSSGFEQALGAAGMDPKSYNDNIPRLYASFARAGIQHPADWQTPMFAARSMVNSPDQYERGALVTQGKAPWIEGSTKGRAPVKITAKDRSAMEDMVANLAYNRLGESPDKLDELPIPPEALFAARQKGEDTYTNNRSQTDAAQAMLEALKIPPGGKLGSVDSTPGPNFGGDFPYIHPSNWGGSKPAILDSSGVPVNYDFAPASPAAPAEAAPAAPAAAPPQNNAALVAEARAAIAKGADPAAVAKRLQTMGIDPRGL